MKLRLFLALPILALGLVSVQSEGAHAQPAPRDQLEAEVVFDSDRGQYLIAWVEDRGAGNRLYAKRIHSNGLPVGGADSGEWELTGDTADAATAGAPKGAQRQPSIDDGLLVWSEMAPGAADFDIYAQRIFPNFRSYGRPTVIAGGPGNQMHPDVVTSGRRGEWLVVWSEDTNDAGDVLGVRISQALTPRSNVFEVAKGPGVAEDPSIARDLFDNDSFLVAFTDDRNGNKDIFGVRITEAGVPRGGPLGGAFEIVVSPEDDYAAELVFNPTNQPLLEPPRIRGGGSLSRNVLLWTHDHVTDGPDVLAQRLSNNGLVSGSPFVLAGGPGIQQGAASDLRDGDHGRELWLVAWADDATGTLDIVGTDLGVNGIVRRPVRALVAD